MKDENLCQAVGGIEMSEYSVINIPHLLRLLTLQTLYTHYTHYTHTTHIFQHNWYFDMILLHIRTHFFLLLFIRGRK